MVIAATPVAASPTTSNPPLNLSAVRTSRRASGASSTSSTRTGTSASIGYPPSASVSIGPFGNVITNAASSARYDASPPCACASSRTM